ncbi:Uncharacterised protein [Vibrio cholerae]|nr:Uncharacterised protein [Vibrio cholerae]CSI46547.1 Uncharacterised protein [Vibrio cholerae]
MIPVSIRAAPVFLKFSKTNASISLWLMVGKASSRLRLAMWTRFLPKRIENWPKPRPIFSSTG